MLAEQYGMTLPLVDTVDEISKQYYDALEVQMAIDGPTTVEDLLDELGFDENDLETRKRTLERTGRATLVDGIVYPRRGE